MAETFDEIMKLLNEDLEKPTKVGLEKPKKVDLEKPKKVPKKASKRPIMISDPAFLAAAKRHLADHEPNKMETIPEVELVDDSTVHTAAVSVETIPAQVTTTKTAKSDVQPTLKPAEPILPQPTPISTEPDLPQPTSNPCECIHNEEEFIHIPVSLAYNQPPMHCATCIYLCGMCFNEMKNGNHTCDLPGGRTLFSISLCNKCSQLNADVSNAIMNFN